MNAVDGTASMPVLLLLLGIIGIGIIAATAYRRPKGRTALMGSVVVGALVVVSALVAFGL